MEQPKRPSTVFYVFAFLVLAAVVVAAEYLIEWVTSR